MGDVKISGGYTQGAKLHCGCGYWMLMEFKMLNDIVTFQVKHQGTVTKEAVVYDPKHIIDAMQQAMLPEWGCQFKEGEVLQGWTGQLQ